MSLKKRFNIKPKSKVHCWRTSDDFRLNDLDKELKNKLPNEFKHELKGYNYNDYYTDNDVYLNGSKIL